MYRYIQSPKFVSNLEKYAGLIDEKSLNNFFRDLSNAPRKAKGAHSLHKPLSRFNMWSAHFRSRSKSFFTVLYLICDSGINKCGGNIKLCKSFIPKCEQPIQQIVFLTVEIGEPYDKLSQLFC